MPKLALKITNMTTFSNYRYGLGLISCVLFLSTTNCSKVEFSTIDPSEKANLLQNESIFNEGGLSGSDFINDNPFDNTGDDGYSNPPGNDRNGNTTPPRSDGHRGNYSPGKYGKFYDYPSGNDGGSTPPGNDGDGAKNPPGNDDDGSKAPPGTDDSGKKTPPGIDEGGGKAPPGTDDSGKKTPPGIDEGGGKPPPRIDTGLPSSLQFYVHRMCSNDGHIDAGSTVAHSKKLKVILSIFESEKNLEIPAHLQRERFPKLSASCVLENQNIRDQIINTSRVTLDITSCKGILAATPSINTERFVHINIVDADTNDSLLYVDNNTYTVLYISHLFAGITKLVWSRSGSENRFAARKSVNIIFSDRTKLNQHCTEMLSSPLVVQVRPDEDTENDVINLSPIEDGISFDILGENSTPVPYARKKIGWFNSTQQARQYRFLVKPTRRQIRNYKQGHSFELGINQMFGNNTRNQDGSFSENGYDSLALYDISGSSPMKADRYITGADPVFGQLRLWADLNLNGRVDPRELKSLYQMGLISIDLDFDPNYKETDFYGNTTTLKSVVLFKDGTLKLIFDLWFVYED